MYTLSEFLMSCYLCFCANYPVMPFSSECSYFEEIGLVSAVAATVSC